jgi:hypothetical protein
VLIDQASSADHMVTHGSFQPMWQVYLPSDVWSSLSDVARLVPAVWQALHTRLVHTDPTHLAHVIIVSQHKEPLF